MSTKYSTKLVNNWVGGRYEGSTTACNVESLDIDVGATQSNRTQSVSSCVVANIEKSQLKFRTGAYEQTRDWFAHISPIENSCDA